MRAVGFSQRREGAIKSHEEIESELSKGFVEFEWEHLDRTPKFVRVHLLDDFIVVRLFGILSKGEKQLVRKLPDGMGRDLVKNARGELIEAVRLSLESMIEEITGTKVISLHDISTLTGEEVLCFTLPESQGSH